MTVDFTEPLWRYDMSDDGALLLAFCPSLKLMARGETPEALQAGMRQAVLDLLTLLEARGDVVQYLTERLAP